MFSSFLKKVFALGFLCSALVVAVVAPTPGLAQQTAAPSAIKLSQPIGGTTEVSAFNDYIRVAYRYLLGIVTTVAIIMVMYGGFRYLLGSAVGDIAKGKEIIQNAIIGMILVLCAYVILNTVNPATLVLKVPALQQIRTEQFVFNEASQETIVHQQAEVRGEVCATDSECGGGKCMRSSIATESGALGRSYDPTSDAQLRHGLCSNGTAGATCRCGGLGCLLTNDAVDHGAWSAANIGTTLATNLQGYIDATNNHGTGYAPCQPGLKCIYFANGFADGKWTCQDEPLLTGADAQRVLTAHNQDGNKTPCSTDAQCGAGKVCLRLASATQGGRDLGECAIAGTAQPDGSVVGGGLEGQRCKCRGYGCGIFPGVQRRVNLCATGLECRLLSSSSPDGLDAQWFCGPPKQDACLALCEDTRCGSDENKARCRQRCETARPSNSTLGFSETNFRTALINALCQPQTVPYPAP